MISFLLGSRIIARFQKWREKKIEASILPSTDFLIFQIINKQILILSKVLYFFHQKEIFQIMRENSLEDSPKSSRKSNPYKTIFPSLVFDSVFCTPKVARSSRQPSNENMYKHEKILTKRKAILSPRPSQNHDLNNELAILLKSNRAKLDNAMKRQSLKLNETFFNLYVKENDYTKMLDVKKRIQKRTNANKLKHTEAGFSSHQVTPYKTSHKQLILPQILTQYRMGSQILRSSCKDSIFSSYRCGASLAAHDGSLYLYGGYPWKSNESKLYLHKYDTEEANWQELPHHGDLPLFSTSYHTCETFKNYLLVIGGYGAMSISKKTRFFNKGISAYDLERRKWFRFDWKVSLRAHATVLYDNILIVFGGIDQTERYSHEMHFVVLNGSSIHNSVSFTFDMKKNSPTQVRPLAYHKLVHTYDVDPNLKDLLMYNGVYLFGGKSENSRGEVMMHNQVHFFNPKSNENKFLENKVKGWETLIVKGKKPKSRFSHSFHILNRQASCIVLGGVGKHEQTLNDAWVLDLIHLNWVEATLNSFENPLASRGLHSHCSVVINSEVYIFGGIHKDSQVNTSLIEMGSNLVDSSCSLKQTTFKPELLKLSQSMSKGFDSLRAGERLLSIVLFNCL